MLDMRTKHKSTKSTESTRPKKEPALEAAEAGSKMLKKKSGLKTDSIKKTNSLPRKVSAEVVDNELEPKLDSQGFDEIETTSDSKALAPSDPVALYMAEIRKYPLLSKEQEFELAKKYFDTKDPAAAQALVTANLRFVVKVAAEYSRFSARLIDLIQEGNMGLMHAVKDFNPYKGVRLITYAVWWIRGYIQEYLMKQYSLVKIGTTQNQKKLFYRLQKEKENLDRLAEGSSMALLASKMGMEEEEVKNMAQRLSGRDVSLNVTVDDESTTSLLDMQKAPMESPEEDLAKREELEYLKESIERLKPSLSEREKIILEERILNDEPLTLQEIGEKYGITREAVRQVEARLMKKIKEDFKRGN